MTPKWVIVSNLLSFDVKQYMCVFSDNCVTVWSEHCFISLLQWFSSSQGLALGGTRTVSHSNRKEDLHHLHLQCRHMEVISCVFTHGFRCQPGEDRGLTGLWTVWWPPMCGSLIRHPHIRFDSAASWTAIHNQGKLHFQISIKAWMKVEVEHSRFFLAHAAADYYSILVTITFFSHITTYALPSPALC